MLVPLPVHTLFQNQTLNSEHVKRSGLKAEFLSQFCQLTFGSFSLLFCLTMLDLATQENGDHSWHMASVPNLPWPFSKQTTYLEHKRMISRASLKFVQTLVPPLLSLHRSLESIFDVFLDSKVYFCKERRSAIYKYRQDSGCVPPYKRAPISYPYMKRLEMLASPWFVRLGRPHSAQSSQVSHPTSMPAIRRCVYKSEKHLQYPIAQGKPMHVSIRFISWCPCTIEHLLQEISQTV